MNTWHADFDQSATLMHCDIAIIGAGTVGMVAGIELASRGYQVVILDNKPMPTAKGFADRLAVRDARVYALSQGSIRLLAEIGVWSDIVRRADYQTMQVWARDDYGELLFDGSQSHEILGSMVEPSVLDAALVVANDRIAELEAKPKKPTVAELKAAKTAEQPQE